MDRNYVDFRLAPDDISAIRFGVSPGHELSNAIRVLQRPGDHPLQWGWLRGAQARLPRAPFELLTVVIGAEGYFPDFFTATPHWDSRPEDEFALLRETPPERLRADLQKMVVRTTGARQRAILGMIDQPLRARAAITDAFTELWDAVLAPVWPQIERILRADIAVRSKRIATGGLAEMVDSLHRTVRWSQGAVRVELRKHSEVLDCLGSGLVLVPSVMTSHGCSVLTEPPVQPTLFYPALGVTETWARESASAAAALGALLGPMRAQILLRSHDPRTTSQLAADHGIAASTASHHLTILRESGLVASSRDGARVFHVRTPLGEAIVAAAL